jgi:hypothetical protein
MITIYGLIAQKKISDNINKGQILAKGVIFCFTRILLRGLAVLFHNIYKMSNLAGTPKMVNRGTAVTVDPSGSAQNFKESNSG